MNKYESYQDTDNWYGCIPCSWENHRIKRLFALRDERSYLPLSEVNLISLYSSIGVRQHSDIEHTTGNRARNADGYKIVHRDDIIVNILLCWMGAIGRSDYDGVTSPAYDVYMPRKGVNSQYYHYLFRTTAFSGECYKAGKGIMAMRWRTYSPQFMDITVPVPPRAEQDQIVRFLDWKVSEINKLIGIRKKEIQEFNQLKNTVITKTVTTGLKRGELCGTDNSYYRMIPKGWRITKTLRVLSQPLTDGPHTTPQLYEEGIPFVSAEAVSCGNGKIDFNHIRGFISQDFYEECCKKYVPKIDDIYMIKSGATTGRVSIVDTDRIFTIWSPLAVFRCNQEVMLPRFLFYALQALPYQQQVQDGWSYGTQQNIGMRVLEQLKLAYPDVTEQEKIACYLDDKCDMLDKAIQLAESKIKALQELKSTIISDVVTGKIDVRNITVPEYEHVDDIVDDDSENNDETETDGEEA